MLLAATSGLDVFMMLVIGGIVFATTFMVVYGLFNQPVEVRTSYQREAAILAGHTDRQTVFEISWLSPIMWVLLSLASGLSVPRLKRSIQRNLIASGNPSYYSVNEYLALSLLIGTVLSMLIILGGMIGGQDFNLLVTLFAWIIGFWGPIFRLSGKAKARVRVISRKIPYALDLIALSMGAGATFTEAVRTLVREDPADEFNRELSQVLAEVELGKTRNEALQNLSDRIPLESLRTIVGAILQAESLGTPLTDVLKSQSNLLRHQRSVRAEKLAATASVRILIPSVLILIAVVIIVFAPVIIRWYRGTLFG
ncbi:MAG: type II secretion system F family protein [Phycisphaerae bacterium]|nr:type II secretion system F family protein [Phycisphaerae bacterium]